MTGFLVPALYFLGIEEHLEKDYPLFYNTPKEAITLLRNKIGKTSHYLAAHCSKTQLTGEEYIKHSASCAVHWCLPLPPLQKADPTYRQGSLTVVICLTNESTT